jgi:hypothetical protein
MHLRSLLSDPCIRLLALEPCPGPRSLMDFGLRSEAFSDMDKFMINTECFFSEKKLFRSTSYAISSIHDRLLSGFITDVQAAIAACDDYNNHENWPVRPKNMKTNNDITGDPCAHQTQHFYRRLEGKNLGRAASQEGKTRRNGGNWSVNQGWKNEGAASPDPARGNRRDWGTLRPKRCGDSTRIHLATERSRGEKTECARFLVKTPMFKWTHVGMLDRF